AGRAAGIALLVGCGSGCAAGGKPAPVSPASNQSKPKPASPEERLRRGEERLRESEYALAEADLRSALQIAPGRAGIALAELLRITGRLEAAVTAARQARTADASYEEKARVIAAQALFDAGHWDEAKAEVEPMATRDKAWLARLQLAEIELAAGKIDRAQPLLMSLIEAYNDSRIDETDSAALSLVARAAWLLRSHRDANTLFTAAEQAGKADARLLLWRTELFLEKYDPANAEQIVEEVLAKAPKNPEALTLLAEVRLSQALDFAEAERLAREALAVNPRLARAHFVLAGVALRDMELARAEAQLGEGLRGSPRDLNLLSLQAVVKFLADDATAYQLAKQRVFELSPKYSRFYSILGEYADWEHRYSEIVEIMKEALTVDDKDPLALAQLGFNLIRSGDEAPGVSALSRAFSLDPYNVRVYNTLELYDTLIPKAYVTSKHARFLIRYHKDDRDVLERYVPALLDRAFDAMREGYGFAPELPIGVELYAERQSFAIRTSGLPQTAIQGVCFGRTLAALSPQQESFNLGMTLWHELSHVFHIQLSRSRVPRWFTEGLAEYETLSTRPEWSRHHDLELFELMRAGRLPQVANMSRAFTRAEAISDVATAYYASSRLVAMLAERVGRAKIAEMLRAWGAGKNTSQVVEAALGMSLVDLDSQFRASLAPMQARYERQFVPVTRARPVSVLEPELSNKPKSLESWVELARAELDQGDVEAAERAAQAALKLKRDEPQAEFVLAQVARARDNAPLAAQKLSALVARGVDGYAIAMAQAELSTTQSDKAAAAAQYKRALTWDSTQAEPLLALASMAREAKDTQAELEYLKPLAVLAPHQPAVQLRYVRALLEQGRVAEAVLAGETAIYSDMLGFETHRAYAQALAKDGKAERARFEYESALLCKSAPERRAELQNEFATLLEQMGQRAAARKQREAAQAATSKPANRD
ncbi:MAG TPA: tetratricopeptide repeat protein, partial [Polyangiaceae bacterium]|nr:tetratricopeptide repeat protein [Polyangiaceae bacterium]